MKEDIIYCKEGNPFVSIPCGLSLVVAACSSVQILTKGWLDLDGFFSRILNLFSLLMVAGLFIGPACYEFFVNFLFNKNTEPNTVYIKTKSARAWLVVSVIAALIFLAYQLAQIEKPDFFSILSKTLLVLSAFGCMLISIHIIAALTIDVPNKIKPERTGIGISLSLSAAGALIACMSLAFYAKGVYPIGGQVFLLSSVSSIAILWTEHRQACIADHEITPLATASLAWMAAAYSVKSYHAELSAISFAIPYFVYLAPVGILGAYYYITQPERA